MAKMPGTGLGDMGGLVLEDRAAARSHVERVMRDLVRPAVYAEREPFEVAAHHVDGEPIPASDALAAAFAPFAVGEPWGSKWATTWFRLRATIPAAWASREVVALVRLGGAGQVGFAAEGLIWSAHPQLRPVQGLHHRHPAHVVSTAARGGEQVELYVEAAANPAPPWAQRDWPLLMPEPEGPPIYVLGQAEMATADRMVEALWFDMHTLLQLFDRVAGEPRRSRILRALAEAANAVDPGDVAATAERARSILAPQLDAPSVGGHLVSAVGHAHIDTAWLWPLRETRRKCARTFSNQLRLMEAFPDYRFACSQAQQYAWIKEDHPTLWTAIKERVASGQWEPVGGMWVEADTNLPSGESLVRQLVHGKRFFLDELGVETHELWIPDVFGYSAALPQIARQAGADALVTQKMSWNTMNPFPHHSFWWEGHDGSRLFTHFPPAATYSGDWQVDQLVSSVDDYRDHGRCDRSLYPFGYGDGGGGPTREMLEHAERMKDLEGLPPVELETVASFLDKARAESADLGVWVGELYLETHRGTYTSQAAVKRGNRRGEEALRAAELWSVALAARTGDWDGYPVSELDAAWKLLLLHQFHDIIPGSAIHWVYEDARRDQAAVVETARAIVGRAQAALADGEGLTAFNPGSSHRIEVVEVVDSGKEPYLAMASVPACGWAAVDPGATCSAAAAVSVHASCMENALLRVTWDTDGLLTSLWDKEAGREVLAEGRRANVLQLHEDSPNAFDAWDVDLTYLDNVVDITDLESIEVVERGPLRGAVRFVRRFGRSSISQTMSLCTGSRCLRFDNEVDWHERHRFLKVAFPVAVRSTRATYEIQHGHVERPTVANTSWDVARFEVSAHRWADLSEHGYGVALLNDSKYGYDIRGDVMRLSLLRGPGYPDPEADRGLHRFAYALLPHPGDLRERGAVVAEAEALNLPLDVVRGTATECRVVSVDRPGVSVEAVKKADREHAVVVRVCEVWGSRGPVTVSTDMALTSVSRTDLLERDQEQLSLDGAAVTVDLRPFELVTLKFALAGAPRVALRQ